MVDTSAEWDCHIRLKSILVGENDAKRVVLKTLFGKDSPFSFSVNLQNVMFDVSGFRCCMQFWNVPAPQYAPSLRKSSGPYCRNISAVLFAFDVTNKHSFQRLDEWVRVVDSQNVNAVSPSTVEMGKVMIGIRGGDDSKREISKAQVLKFSQKYNIPSIELDGRASESERRELLAKELRRMLVATLNSLPQQVDALCLMGTGMDLGDLALGTILKGGALSEIQVPKVIQVNNLKIIKPSFLVQSTGIVSPIATPKGPAPPSKFTPSNLTASNLKEKSSRPISDPDKEESAPVMYTLGARVHAEWQGGGQWFPAKITTLHSNGTFDVLYDDGAVERQVAEQHIKLMEAPLTSASAFSQQKLQKQKQQQQKREQQMEQQTERARQPKDPPKKLQRQLKSQRRRQKLYGRPAQQDSYSQKFRQQHRGGAAAGSNRGGYGGQHKRSHDQSQPHEPERDEHKPVNARAQNRRSLDAGSHNRGYNGGKDDSYNRGYNGGKDDSYNRGYNGGRDDSYNRGYNRDKDAGHNGSYDAGRVRRSDDAVEGRSRHAHEYGAQRVRKSPLQYPSQDGGGSYGGYNRRDDRRRSYDEVQEHRSRLQLSAVQELDRLPDSRASDFSLAAPSDRYR